MDNFESIDVSSNMDETLEIKPEPTHQEKLQEILPDLPEVSVEIKHESGCTSKCDTNLSKNQESCAIKNNRSSFPSKKIAILLNGILYIIEKIPESLVPKEPNQITSPKKTIIKKHINTAQCSNCNKTFKNRESLKLHMQIYCVSSFYSCPNCPYKTQKLKFWLFHVEKCAEQNYNKQDYFSSICFKCNKSMPISSNTCTKCGLQTHWLCKICNVHFQTYSRVEYHYRTNCGTKNYYSCSKCDYRSIFGYRVEMHMEKHHPELNINDISACFKMRQKSTYRKKSIHECTLCGKKFEEVSGLSRHAILCKKYLFFKQADCKQISNLSQTNSNLALGNRGFRHFIIRHCEICNKDIELEDFGVTFSKSCRDCLSPLVYKCKKCSNLSMSYNMQVRHVKTICNKQKQFNCGQCNTVTYSISRLTEHQRKFHGDISATCTNCGTYFINSIYFKRHIQICGLKPTLQCNLCPFRTSTKVYLKKHMFKMHCKSKMVELSDSNNSSNRNKNVNCRLKSTFGRNDLKEGNLKNYFQIHLKNNKETNLLVCQEPKMQNNMQFTFIHDKFNGVDKLDLESKVVLKRLDSNVIRKYARK